MSKKDNKKRDDKKEEIKKITLTRTPKSHLRQIVGLDTRDKKKKVD